MIDVFEYELDENGNFRGKNVRVVLKNYFSFPFIYFYKDLTERSKVLFTNPILDMVT
jgi:hypothetical protein